MDIKVKKLTIGIPTYNNSNGIKSQLDNILNQLKENPEVKNDVEILISDNSDNSETQHIISDFIKEVPSLVYIKNDTNIGYDRNVDQVLKNASSLFCWTLSDNDPIVKGGIKKIINVIKENADIPHILINIKEKNGNIRIFKNVEELSIENNYEIMGGLVSQNIFNKRYLQKDRSKYYGNYWFHLSVFLEICAGRKILLLPNLLKQTLDTECRWAKNGTTFTTYTNLHSIVMHLRDLGYSSEFLNIHNNNFIKGLPGQVFTSKLYGLKFNRKATVTLYEHSGKNFVTFMLCLMILATPVSIHKLAKNIWKKL